MRQSVFIVSALLLGTAGPAAAQHAIGVTAEITQSLSAAEAGIEVSAVGSAVRVKQVESRGAGTLVLERMYVRAGTATTATDTTWVRAAGLRQEPLVVRRVEGGAEVELGAGGVEVPLTAGRVVVVTIVVAANS